MKPASIVIILVFAGLTLGCKSLGKRMEEKWIPYIESGSYTYGRAINERIRGETTDGGGFDYRTLGKPNDEKVTDGYLTAVWKWRTYGKIFYHDKHGNLLSRRDRNVFWDRKLTLTFKIESNKPKDDWVLKSYKLE